MNLYAYLINSGLSQRKFAQMAGVSDATVSAWIGGYRYPSRKHIAAIMRVTSGVVTGITRSGDFYPQSTITEAILCSSHLY